MGCRVVVVFALLVGCRSTSAIGVGGTSGAGFTVAANSEMGFRVGENFDIGLTSNLHLGNWDRVGNAYGAINDWARSGKVECCGSAAPLVTMFKYFAVGVGYLTAWALSTNATMAGPRLRYYVQQYAPTLYFDLGIGPSFFFAEERNDVVFGIASTAAVGYMFDPQWGLEARMTWGNVDDPEWATMTVGVVIKPKKRFLGLFGRNDLERPPAPPPPAPPPQPPPTQPQPPTQIDGPPGTLTP